MSAHDLVPFGKYKGQPIDVIASDRAYCDWLVAQAWFVERYPQLHTLVINNFGEPSETPEHNALQMRLLDDTFRAQCTERVLQFFYPERQWSHEVPEGTGLMYLHTPVFTLEGPPIFEVEGVDVTWAAQTWTLVHNTRPQSDTLPDTHSSRWMEGGRRPILLECKPLVGDDFPAILRFVKSLPNRLSRLRAVLAGEVRSQTVPLAAIKQFFATSGVLLLLVDEVEEAQPVCGLTCPAQDLAHGAYMQAREGTPSLRCTPCNTVPGHAEPYRAPVTPQRLFEVLRAHVYEKWRFKRGWTAAHRVLVDMHTKPLVLDTQRFVLGMREPVAHEATGDPEILPRLEETLQDILRHPLKVEIHQIG